MYMIVAVSLKIVIETFETLVTVPCTNLAAPMNSNKVHIQHISHLFRRQWNSLVDKLDKRTRQLDGK